MSGMTMHDRISVAWWAVRSVSAAADSSPEGRFVPGPTGCCASHALNLAASVSVHLASYNSDLEFMAARHRSYMCMSECKQNNSSSPTALHIYKSSSMLSASRSSAGNETCSAWMHLVILSHSSDFLTEIGAFAHSVSAATGQPAKIPISGSAMKAERKLNKKSLGRALGSGRP